MLKVRQFIEMVNGTESEIRSTSNLPSISSQSLTTANNLLPISKTRSNSPSCSSPTKTSSARSSSPMTKTQTSSRSRSNSPYTSGRPQTVSTTTTTTQHSNGTVNSSSSSPPSANNPDESTSGSLISLSHSSLIIFLIFGLETNTDANPSQISRSESNNHSNVALNLMDIDDHPSAHTTTNGFSNHGTVTSSSTSISNGHSQVDNDNPPHAPVDHSTNSNGCKKKSSELLDEMDDDVYTDANHTTDMETTISADVQKKSLVKDDEQLLIRILQFGRELHALKQQLTAEHGDNQQNDKMLQVESTAVYFPRTKSSFIRF